jgi:hypothetical protein
MIKYTLRTSGVSAEIDLRSPISLFVALVNAVITDGDD